jgi:hypothetical protein
MTHEQLIKRAIEESKENGITEELLRPRVRKAERRQLFTSTLAARMVGMRSLSIFILAISSAQP